MSRVRPLSRWLPTLVAISLAAGGLPFGSPSPVAAVDPEPIRYTYDALGRLTGVIDPVAGAAIYKYDAAGNVTSIVRQSVTATSIIEFTPDGGSVGRAVTIEGTGFSATPSQNTVKFNGTTATVTAASTTHLVVTVPAGATTGTISVTSPSGTATSSSSFTVRDDSAPAVTSFSPTIGVPGTSVTISGARFETTTNMNRAVFGVAHAQVTAATATSLTALAPPTGTGLVSVRTPNGKGTGANYFFVPPSTYLAADVQYTGSMAPSQTETVTISTANKIGLVAFEGTVGQRISLNVTNVTVTHNVSILNPDGSTFAAPRRVTSTGTFFDTMILPATGTYTVFIDPEATGTGSVQLALYEVPADASASITPGGSPVTLTTTTPGQNASATFSGSQNQRISLNVTGVSVTHNVSILNPDGSTLAGPRRTTSTGTFFDTMTLAATGTYAISIDPEAAGTGSVTLTLYDVPADVSASITPGGSPVTLTTTTPGQNASATFSGTQDQRISLRVTGVTVTHDGTILNPDGSPLAGPRRTTSTGTFFDTMTLGATGTYTISINPEAAGIGSVTLTLYDVPADPTASMTIGGPAVILTTTTPGQDANATFDGTTGQQVRLTLSAVSIPESDVSVLNPDGSTLVAPVLVTTSGRTIDTTLIATGSHKVVINPRSTHTGSMTLQLTLWTGLGPTEIVLASTNRALLRDRDGLFAGLLDSAIGSAPLGGETEIEGAPPQADQPGPEEWVPGPRNFRGDWTSGRPKSPWEDQERLTAPLGETALSGVVLRLNGLPLAGVTVAIGRREARTDRTGRFLLEGIRAGRHQLVIDGRTANRGNRTYGFYEARVIIEAARTNDLPYTIWMPKLDTAHTVAVDFPTREDIILTTPRIPGLQVRIPAGSKITDGDGRPVTELGITAIPIDRAPFPLPVNTEIPVYFTVQPGGASIEAPGGGYAAGKGARVIYPNYPQLRPGTKTQFWSYDPEEVGWYIYGLGTVDPEGKRVVPDPGVVIHRFTGFMFGTDRNPPATWPEGETEDGDPVNLATGIFVLEKTDLVLPGVAPLALTRTYRPNDPESRFFGIGATHDYEMFLWSAEQYQQVDLILPDGAKIHYVRAPESPGNDFEDAIFEHTATPGAYYESKITWNGNGWDLRLRDGTVYVFGENAPLQAIRDRNGNSITLYRVSGQSGNITTIRASSGRWITLTYDLSNRIIQAKDNFGRTVGYTYDASGRLWKVTNPAGGVTVYTYDPSSHRLLTIKDARNIVFLTNEYFDDGRVKKQTQADGTTYQFNYTIVNGEVTQTDVTDPRGIVRRVTFNADGYTLTDTTAIGKPEQRTTTYVREPGSNLPTSVTDGLNRRTEFGYDSLGNLTSLTRLAGTPDAVTSTMTYEPTFNQLASVTDPLDHTTVFDHDANGDLRTIADPRGKLTTFTYNPAGQPITITDATSKQSTLSYDMGDLISATDAAGNTTSRFIDGAGRLAALSDPLAARTRYEYDSLNRPTKNIDALGGETRFTYDANGNVLTLTDPRNNVTTYTYNNMDRVATRKDPLNKTETYTYDAGGNLTKVIDRAAIATAFIYDPLGRRTLTGFKAVTNQQGQTTYESTITWTYDVGDRLRTVLDSANGTITLGYDDLDRLTSETSPDGSVTYSYDDASLRRGMTVSGQSPITYTYDEADRLKLISQGSTSVAIDYDDAGRRTSLTLPNGIVAAYGHDDASRLTSLGYTLGQTTLGNLAYTHDAAGRRSTVGGGFARTSLPAAQGTTAYDAGNRLTRWGSARPSYDAIGNMTADGTYTYVWNSRGQLIQIKTGQTVTASFAYDGLGRRRSRTVGATTTGFVYDGVNVVQELSGGSPSANLLSGGLDEIFQRTDASGARSLLADGLGSTLALADSAGTLQTSYTYEPFGKPTISGQANTNGFQFAARESDGTGLLFYRARYYHPTFGRFIAEDPIGFAGGDVNLYAYVGSSVVNRRDPSGSCGVDTVLDAGFVILDLGILLGHSLQNLFQGKRKDLGTDLVALGLDAGGILVPCGAGAGWIYRFNRAQNAIDVVLRERKIQAQFKHAEDFAIIGNSNKANRQKFAEAIAAHIARTKPVAGSFRGQPGNWYYDPATGNGVFVNAADEFVTGFRLNPDQLQHFPNIGGGP